MNQGNGDCVSKMGEISEIVKKKLEIDEERIEDFGELVQVMERLIAEEKYVEVAEFLKRSLTENEKLYYLTMWEIEAIRKEIILNYCENSP